MASGARSVIFGLSHPLGTFLPFLSFIQHLFKLMCTAFCPGQCQPPKPRHRSFAFWPSLRLKRDFQSNTNNQAFTLALLVMPAHKLRKLFRLLPNQNSLGISNKYQNVSLSSVKHWSNGEQKLCFAQLFFSFFYRWGTTRSRKDGTNVWFQNTRREIFLSYCFASDMINSTKPRGVYQVWWHWWICFLPWRKKVPAAKLRQSFTPTGFCYLCFLLNSLILLYLIYNPQDTPSKASQTIFHMSSHQVIINQLLLYLLLGILCSGGSLVLRHIWFVPLLLLGLPSSHFPFVIVQFSAL